MDGSIPVTGAEFAARRFKSFNTHLKEVWPRLGARGQKEREPKARRKNTFHKQYAINNTSYNTP
jgi:hypothetical protein